MAGGGRCGWDVMFYTVLYNAAVWRCFEALWLREGGVDGVCCAVLCCITLLCGDVLRLCGWGACVDGVCCAVLCCAV